MSADVTVRTILHYHVPSCPVIQPDIDVVDTDRRQGPCLYLN